jgi:hypothetical protein
MGYDEFKVNKLPHWNSFVMYEKLDIMVLN